MTWNVEYTDELDLWWSSLDESEQESVSASVGLLEVRGRILGFRIAVGSMARDTNLCASCGFSIAVGLIECSRRLIPGVL